jgi:putative endonuclease
VFGIASIILDRNSTIGRLRSASVGWLQGWLARWRRKPSVGELGERHARRHLKRHGYRIRAKNLTCRFGELDIVAESPDRRRLVIVEVKAGTNTNYPPEVHLTRQKQRKLIQLTWYFLGRARMRHWPVRFDVVVVHWDGGRRPTVRHYVNAFEAK